MTKNRMTCRFCGRTFPRWRGYRNSGWPSFVGHIRKAHPREYVTIERALDSEFGTAIADECLRETAESELIERLFYQWRAGREATATVR